MDIRSLQRRLKDAYRQAPSSSRITLAAPGRRTDAPISCSMDLGRAIQNELHDFLSRSRNEAHGSHTVRIVRH
jgi:hypothetical protein